MQHVLACVLMQVVTATKPDTDVSIFNRLFMENKYIGLALFAGIVGDKVLM